MIAIKCDKCGKELTTNVFRLAMGDGATQVELHFCDAHGQKIYDSVSAFSVYRREVMKDETSMGLS